MTTLAKTCLALVCSSFLFALPAESREWSVQADGSGEFTRIQEAIDAASPGDTVAVGCGTYRDTNIPYAGSLGACILLKPGVTLLGAGSTCVFVDGESNHRVVYASDLGASVLVKGFSFINGSAPGGYTWRDGEAFSTEGGTLVCQRSSLRFEDCRFVDGYALEIAGGVYLRDNSSAVFEDCVWQGNSSDDFGGALQSSYSNVVLTRCEIRNSQTAHHGAAIGVAGPGTQIELTACWIVDNDAGTYGGAIRATSGTQVYLTNCVLLRNSALGVGGAISANLSGVHLDHCTLVGNVAGTDGGAVSLASQAFVDIAGSIITDSGGNGAIYCPSGTEVFVECSDAFGNAGGDWPPCMDDQGGVFSADPEFCGLPGSDYYYLQSDSPCAPGGHPDGHACSAEAQIGALPVACSTVATERTSWGRLKARY
jgi:hypothetical protein